MSHPALLITCYYEPVCITDKMDLAKYKHANQVFLKKILMYQFQYIDCQINGDGDGLCLCISPIFSLRHRQAAGYKSSPVPNLRTTPTVLNSSRRLLLPSHGRAQLTPLLLWQTPAAWQDEEAEREQQPTGRPCIIHQVCISLGAAGQGRAGSKGTQPDRARPWHSPVWIIYEGKYFR